MIAPSLLQIVCCPETHQALKLADQPLLDQLNHEIARGVLKNRAGVEVTERLDEALVRADGRIVYPVRNDIPVLLAGEGIPTSQARSLDESPRLS